MSAPATPTTTTPVVVSTSAPSSTDNSCPRIRREWNTLDQSERDLYINGLLTLSRNGVLDKFTEQHGQAEAEAQAHGTSGFLTWHRFVCHIYYYSCIQ